jgi:hypothetical protein
MAMQFAFLERNRLLARANTLLPGLYAWTLTVAVPAHSRGAPAAARLAAWVAPCALVAGVALAPRWPKLGRTFGITVFVGLCLLTWIVVGSAVGSERLDLIEAGLGGVGWALFAMGWGTAREPGRIPEEDPRVVPGPSLASRGELGRGARAVLAVAVVLALLPFGFAWTSRRPAHALLAQGVALLVALALVHAGSLVATGRGRPLPTTAPSARLRSASSPLMLLGCTLLLGLVWAVWRPE